MKLNVTAPRSAFVARRSGQGHTFAELLDEMPAAENANTAKSEQSPDQRLRSRLGAKACGQLCVADCSDAIGAAPGSPACPIRHEAHFTRRDAMSDKRKNRPPQDAARINLAEEEEVRYWTQALGVTKEQLASAAKSTGLQVDAVRRHFAK